MLLTMIEDKIKDLLQGATIDDVETYKAVGIEDYLLDWESPEDYPRIIVACDEIRPEGTQIQAVTKEYVVNIFLLCYNADKDTVITQRDTVYDRIENVLRANQRLDNLADNTNNERVFSSSIERARFSKIGNVGYQATAWIELIVYSERLGPFN